VSNDLSGLTALVTGGSRGIGLATARALAASGARVGVVARGEEDLLRVAGEIAGEAFVADLTSAAGVDSLRAQVFDRFDGAPDILVNSAGAFDVASFSETAPETFDAQISANLVAPFLTTRAFLPGMISRGSGHIVNVGSIAGRVALPGNSAYGASKFGLRGLHEVLVAELQGSGVRTTMIEPAATDTPLWDVLDPDNHPHLPNRAQMLRPEAVAAAILFAVAQPPQVEVSYLAIRANS
jgi:NAD(P)-dependent dehydrogenase (short-subunit alcohol dehydrogenase family)